MLDNFISKLNYYMNIKKTFYLLDLIYNNNSLMFKKDKTKILIK